jgi:hypothetical protein
MTEILWILASIALTIGWIYTKDTIRTDKRSGNMDFYTYIAAIIGVFIVYRFINKFVMKKI